MGQNGKENQDHVSQLPGDFLFTTRGLLWLKWHAVSFTNEVQDPSKVPATAWGAWSLNYMGACQSERRRGHIFSCILFLWGLIYNEDTRKQGYKEL